MWTSQRSFLLGELVARCARPIGINTHTTLDTNYGAPTNQVRWELLCCCRHLLRVILYLYLLVNTLGELKIDTSPALSLCFSIPNRESTAMKGSNLLSNTPTRRVVIVTESLLLGELVVKDSRPIVHGTIWERDRNNYKPVVPEQWVPEHTSARIYFNRKEDNGPQTPCSRRASLQKSSQSFFLVHG